MPWGTTIQACRASFERIAPLKAKLEERGGEPHAGKAAGRSAGEADIRRILDARRLRDRMFGTGLFGDPAWDILLVAFAAALGGRPARPDELAAAAGVADGTARRWIAALERHGWLAGTEVSGHGGDVSLSADGMAMLGLLFERLGAEGFIS